ncbi:MAG: hypothetical protein BWY96_03165 [Spirochaetes bacterium ADurb.BinA120]|nr:MAG: hypothetical protein BWY96_03165 [Spirochaetes bacterium ADurb.BinA120]
MRTAGSRLTARSAAMAMVSVLVQARGVKRRPSWSTSVNMGRKETAMTNSEKNTEGPTSMSASRRVSWKSPFLPFSIHSSIFL